MYFLDIFRGVDPSEALRQPGVKRYVDVDDVPGCNATGPVIFDEEIFASGKVCSFLYLFDVWCDVICILQQLANYT